MIENLLHALMKTPFVDTLAMKLVKNIAEQIMIIDINKKFLKKTNQEMFEDALYYNIPITKYSGEIIDKMLENPEIKELFDLLKSSKEIDAVKALTEFKHTIKLHVELFDQEDAIKKSSTSKKDQKVKFS